MSQLSSSSAAAASREIIHVALGDVACHVSIHWINLQGLAATSNDAWWEPNITQSIMAVNSKNHYQQQQQYFNTEREMEVYVPRAVFVSSADQYNTSNTTTTVPYLNKMPSPVQATSPAPPISTSTTMESQPLTFPTWNQKIEIMNVSNDPRMKASSSILNSSNSYIDPLFQQNAEKLAYSTFSRYRCCRSSSGWNGDGTTGNSNSRTHQPTHPTIVSTGRHVNWDMEGTEENDDNNNDDDDYYHHHQETWTDPEDYEEIQHRQEQQRQQEWKQQYQSKQDTLDDYWKNRTTTTSTTEISSLALPPTLESHSGSNDEEIHVDPLMTNVWKKFLMPPYHPKMCIDAPVCASMDDIRTQNYYTASTQHNQISWVEDVVWEKLRRMLEECDSCQGLVLMQQSGIFAGWGTALLQIWQEECPNTCPWVINLDQMELNNNNGDQFSTKLQPNVSIPTSNPRNVAMELLQQHVQRGMQLNDQTELADVVLPIQLPTSTIYPNGSSVVSAAAAVTATALECISIPYRLKYNNNNPNAQIGLQSYYSGSGHSGSYGTTTNLTFHEFVQSLQRQSTSRHVLELDGMLPSHQIGDSGETEFYSQLRQGTSLERDFRMRQQGLRNVKEQPPGNWMMGSSSRNHPNGMLTSFTPTFNNDFPVQHQDRSLHHHYALSTSLRMPTSIRPKEKHAPTTPTASNYVTCIMESMGIRYRPEQSMATVVNQSLAQLTTNGYGAGSYWKHILDITTPTTKDTMPQNSTFSYSSYPVLATLGNTTRVYPYLYQTANDLQPILSSRYDRNHHAHSIQRAMYHHSVVHGYNPEVDDITSIVTSLLDLRDTYEPPNGSGCIITDMETDLE